MIPDKPKPDPTPATDAPTEKNIKPADSAEILLAIGREFSKDLPGPPIDHADLLYDDEGLPR